MNTKELINAFIQTVRMLAPLSDAQIRSVLINAFEERSEDMEEIARAVDVCKMRDELKKMRRSPQKYARKVDDI